MLRSRHLTDQELANHPLLEQWAKQYDRFLVRANLWVLLLITGALGVAWQLGGTKTLFTGLIAFFAYQQFRMALWYPQGLALSRLRPLAKLGDGSCQRALDLTNSVSAAKDHVAQALKQGRQLYAVDLLCLRALERAQEVAELESAKRDFGYSEELAARHSRVTGRFIFLAVAGFAQFMVTSLVLLFDKPVWDTHQDLDLGSVLTLTATMWAMIYRLATSLNRGQVSQYAQFSDEAYALLEQDGKGAQYLRAQQAKGRPLVCVDVRRAQAIQAQVLSPEKLACKELHGLLDPTAEAVAHRASNTLKNPLSTKSRQWVE